MLSSSADTPAEAGLVSLSLTSTSGAANTSQSQTRGQGLGVVRQPTGLEGGG